MPALQVRLGDDEYVKVKESAKSAGVSMSEYVRSRLFDDPPPVADPMTPTLVPRPRPPRIPVNAEGVISAPARKVPLPPVRRRFVKMASLKDEMIDVLGALKVAAETCAVVPAPEPRELAPPLPPGIPPPPEPDVLDDLPPLSPTDAEFEALLPTPAEMAVIMPKEPPSLPTVSKPQAVAWDRPKKTTFKRAKKCTSQRCENLQTATCDACRQANAVGF